MLDFHVIEVVHREILGGACSSLKSRFSDFSELHVPYFLINYQPYADLLLPILLAKSRSQYIRRVRL